MHEARARYRAIVGLADAYLDGLAATPESDARAARELALRSARARALLAVEGYTEAVERAYEEALEPIRAGGIKPRSFPILRDLSRLYLGSGRFLKAEMIGRELLELADEQDDPAMRLDARLLIGNGRMWAGELHTSLELLEASIAEFERVGGGARGFRIGPDPRISTLTTSAFIRSLLGYPDTGRRAHRRCGRAGAGKRLLLTRVRAVPRGVPAAVACRAGAGRRPGGGAPGRHRGP